MRRQEATAEVFWSAFKALGKKEREKVVLRLLRDEEFAEDVVDAALIESRAHEPERPVEDYLRERRKRRRSSPASSRG